MKLKITLTLIFNLLFFNNVYAISEDAHACNKAFDQGDYKSASEFADKALKASNSDREAYICKGRTQSDLGNLAAALQAFQSAEKFSKDTLDKAVVALITGHAYRNAKDHASAITYYEKSLSLADKAKSKPLARLAHLNIGHVHLDTKAYELALNAYQIANKLDANDNDRGISHEQIAAAYLALKQYDLAVEHQVKAYLMHQKSGTIDQFANASVELGRYYFYAKNYTSAESTLKKIIKLANEQGGPYYEAKALAVLAQVKAATGDSNAAHQLAEDARKVAKTMMDSEFEAQITNETASIM